MVPVRFAEQQVVWYFICGAWPAPSSSYRSSYQFQFSCPIFFFVFCLGCTVRDDCIQMRENCSPLLHAASQPARHDDGPPFDEKNSDSLVVLDSR